MVLSNFEYLDFHVGCGIVWFYILDSSQALTNHSVCIQTHNLLSLHLVKSWVSNLELWGIYNLHIINRKGSECLPVFHSNPNPTFSWNEMPVAYFLHLSDLLAVSVLHEIVDGWLPDDLFSCFCSNHMDSAPSPHGAIPTPVVLIDHSDWRDELWNE